MTTKKSPKRYDASGFVTQKIASVGGSVVTHACAYDTLGRLVSESVTNAVTSFSYDSAGNRLGSAGATPATFDYVNNRLVSVAANGAAASAVLYDAAGNVTSLVSRAGVTLSLSWNTLGQLVSVSTNGAFAESYAYDALGRRVSTTSLSTVNHEPSTIFHAYDGDQCAADTDAAGNPLRSYTWGPGTDNLLAVTVCSSGATNTCYAIRDHLGSVCSLVDASGANQEECRYGAWGETAILNASYQPVAVSGIGNRFMFHGGAYSAATGLYQFRARWYSPELGRWLSPDPIGLEGGLNLYEFCRNNPVNFRDPSGLSSYYSNYISDGIHQYGFNGNEMVEFNTSGAALAQGLETTGEATTIAATGVLVVGGSISGVVAGSGAVAEFAPELYLYGGSAAIIANKLFQTDSYLRLSQLLGPISDYIDPIIAGRTPGYPGLYKTLLEDTLYWTAYLLPSNETLACAVSDYLDYAGKIYSSPYSAWP